MERSINNRRKNLSRPCAYVAHLMINIPTNFPNQAAVKRVYSMISIFKRRIWITVYCLSKIMLYFNINLTVLSCNTTTY